jgi:hypothetical protein
MAYRQRTVPGAFPGGEYEEIKERKRHDARIWLVGLVALMTVLIGIALLSRFVSPPGTVPVPEYEYRGR